MDACNVDCKLTKWTPWTQCSKACGGGTQRRVVWHGCVQCRLQTHKVDPVDPVLQGLRWGHPAKSRVAWMRAMSTANSQSGPRGPSAPRLAVGAPSEESCGMDACNVDCKLTKWTPWTQCSKAC